MMTSSGALLPLLSALCLALAPAHSLARAPQSAPARDSLSDGETLVAPPAPPQSNAAPWESLSDGETLETPPPTPIDPNPNLLAPPPKIPPAPRRSLIRPPAEAAKLSTPRSTPVASLAEAPALGPEQTLSFPVEPPEPDPNAHRRPAAPRQAPPEIAPEPPAAALASFFEGAWSGVALANEPSSGPVSACESRVSAEEGQARARAGSIDIGALISSDQGWRLAAESGSQSWAWSKAPGAGPDRAALVGPGLSCALARPAAFRSELLRAKALARLPAPAGSIALMGFEIKDGAIGRACAAFLSPNSALIRIGSDPDLSLSAERLSFERPAPIQSASALFYLGGSARLAHSPSGRTASLFVAPSPASPGARCELAAEPWWEGMAPAAEPGSP